MKTQSTSTTGSRWWMLALVALVSLPPTCLQAQRVESQAITGRPFGVAVVTLPMQDSVPGPFLSDDEGRVRYPALSGGGLLRTLVGADQVAAGPRTVSFLFTGDGPLRITLHAPTLQTFVLQPESQTPRNYSRLLQRWWRDYNQAADAVSSGGDYPPQLPTYLTGMLAQRLGLRPPLITRLRQENTTDLQQLIDLLAGTERLQQVVLRETMTGARNPAPADQSIPADVLWRAPEVSLDAVPELEPIAKAVPAECFYVRFGSFENYLWLEELMNSHGGDLSRMVTARGQSDQASERLRNQLALPQSALAKLVGGQLIADVALIGRDFYLQDGAAIGVLFHARSGTLLSVSINQQRNLTLASERDAGGTLETVQVGGRDVSFLSTPDNRVRSFYAVDGDFHLATTSRAIVEQFFDAASGKGSLADLPEFQRTRAAFPIDRKDTVFAFLSTPFLGGLLAPQYQIELNRRTQAVVDLELVQLARLAAAGEGQSADGIDELIAGGFLPSGFGRQPDGSGPIVETDRVIDSLRGARGSLLPIPDVELHQVTAEESARYQALAASYFQKWQQLDPVCCAIRREKLADNRERLTADANISPLSEEKYGRVLSVLGPPVTQRVVPRAGDVISAQAFVTGGQFSNVVPPHLLFVGVQDLPAPADLGNKGLLQWLRLLQTTPGYLGAWPKPGFIDWLPLRADAAPPEGLSRLLFDVWRWQGDGFSVLSFQRNVLDSVTPQLLIAESDDPAQLRIQIGDLAQSQLRDWINATYYQRAWTTSLANSQLLDAFIQQLRVPPDEARAITERLLGTRLICPLGGTYKLETLGPGRSAWNSTAWPELNPAMVPADFEAPLLKWFRGLDFSLAKVNDQVNVRLRLDLQR